MASILIMAIAAAVSQSNAIVDGETVAGLDRAYQAAVKRNDADAMGRILHPNFQLVLGSGRKVDRTRLMDQARRRVFTYELQDEERESQSVMVVGDVAIVTAKLQLKGVANQGSLELSPGQTFDVSLWFSDTYVRTPSGWRYLFGQASLPLPPNRSPSEQRTRESDAGKTGSHKP